MQMRSNDEVDRSIVQVPEIVQVPSGMLAFAKQFQEVMMMYTCAIREVKTKFEVLNDELSVRNKRNPIEMIKSRVKKPMSIVEKLSKRGQPITLESMISNLDDVAGVRVICSFLDDIYEVSDMIAKQDDIKIISIKDYIKNPKPNGYSSYHMIIKVPIYLHDVKELIPIELQIRTIAMDFWASLEHKMKYKKSLDEAPQIIKELKECADSISDIDKKMLEIRKNIENMNISQDNSNY